MSSIEVNMSPLTPLARQLRLSPTLKINELVHKQRELGRQVVHLGLGEATLPIPENVLKAHRQACTTTIYLPVAGLIELREVGQFPEVSRWCVFNSL